MSVPEFQRQRSDCMFPLVRVFLITYEKGIIMTLYSWWNSDILYIKCKISRKVSVPLTVEEVD